MKKQTIVYIFITIITIIGCTNRENGQTVQNILPDTDSNEFIIAENNKNDPENVFIPDAFLDLFQNQNLRYFETVLLNNTPLYTVDADETTAKGYIPAGTSIRILAQNNLGNNKYYLVRVNNDSNIWSGWIKREYVVPDINEAILNRLLRQRWVMVLRTGVSARNDILVTTSTRDEYIFVIRRDGYILHRITVGELFRYNPQVGVLPWTTDETIVWLDFFDGPGPFNFGTLDIHTGEITLLNLPPGFGSGAWYALDPDTGDIWYSDYPIHFDAFSAQRTRESGRIFTLFAFNFFTEERRIIDTNIGEGFLIFFDKINGFTFERMNFYEDE